MIGYKLTAEQYNAIQGVYFGKQFFNCVEDTNGNWFLFLTEQDEANLLQEFQYILEITKEQFVAATKSLK